MPRQQNRKFKSDSDQCKVQVHACTQTNTETRPAGMEALSREAPKRGVGPRKQGMMSEEIF